MYGIIDCDNCYCSCEKVFRPDLEGKPIVVLSNNDIGITPDSPIQQDLFDLNAEQIQKMRRLDEVIL